MPQPSEQERLPRVSEQAMQPTDVVAGALDEAPAQSQSSPSAINRLVTGLRRVSASGTLGADVTRVGRRQSLLSLEVVSRVRRASQILLPSRASVAPPPARTGLSGRWRKDWDASDSMEPAAQAMSLPWLVRKAIKFANELQITHDGASFSTSVRAGPVCVSECFPMSGEAREHKRRDLRGGLALGRVVHAQPLGDAVCDVSRGLRGCDAVCDAVCVRQEWDAPFGAVAHERYALDMDGQVLVHETRLEIKAPAGGEPLTFCTVYQRI